MADTYTSSNRFTLIEPGTRNNTWGTGLNNETIGMIDDSLDGFTTIDVSAGNVTLTTNNGLADQARNRTLRLIGDISSNRTITLPDQKKWYNIEVATSGTGLVTLKNVADSTGVTISAGSGNLSIVCDGTSTRSLLSQTDTSDKLGKADNLSDLTNAGTARDNLGLGIVAEASTSSNNIVLGTGADGVVGELVPSQGITVSSGTIKADVATTASAGIIEVATTAEAQAGTDTTKALTPAALAGGGDISANGYYTLPGGLILQWGVTSATFTEGVTTSVTFPTAFATAAHSITLTMKAATLSGTVEFYVVTGPSTSSFGFTQIVGDGTVAGSGSVYWMAIGK